MRKNLSIAFVMALLIGVCDSGRAANTFERYVANGSQFFILKDDGTIATAGSLKYGNDSATPTAPTTTTGGNFGTKIPVTVATTAAVQGTLLCGSNLGVATAVPCTTSAATSIVGIAEGAIAVNAVGFMTTSGYALALTSGTVVPGDVIVSSSVATGYGWANNSPTSGTDIGIALSTGVAAGGLTLIRLR